MCHKNASLRRAIAIVWQPWRDFTALKNYVLSKDFAHEDSDYIILICFPYERHCNRLQACLPGNKGNKSSRRDRTEPVFCLRSLHECVAHPGAMRNTIWDESQDWVSVRALIKGRHDMLPHNLGAVREAYM